MAAKQLSGEISMQQLQVEEILQGLAANLAAPTDAEHAAAKSQANKDEHLAILFLLNSDKEAMQHIDVQCWGQAHLQVGHTSRHAEQCM